MLTIGSLCSGYGGLEMGLQAVVGGTVLWHSEVDPHPAKVLAVRYPGVPNLGDLTTVDWTQVPRVDWLTAGYPCQPDSLAGKGLSEDDERWIWPDIARAIGVLRPRQLLLENVPGHFVRGFRTVLGSLASLGYDATWTLVRASDVGAPHRRERLFVVATDTGRRQVQRRGERPLVGRSPRSSASEGNQRERDGHAAGDSGAATSDAASDGRHEGRPEPARLIGRPDAAERGADALADANHDTARGGQSCGRAGRRGAESAQCGCVSWGEYEPAVRRWGVVLGRPAPCPTIPNGRGGRRLNPLLNEWMMGLPGGWVTDILPRNPALKCVGNGVVPQQAALAVRTLLSLEREVAA